MSKKILSGMALLLAATPFALQARDDAQRATYGFIENKGQVTDQHYQPNNAVKYLLHTAGLNVQLRSNGFSYDAYVATPVEKQGDRASLPGSPQANIAYSYHRVDVTLAGANPNPAMTATVEGNDYINYITPANKEVSVHHYGKVTYKDIYKGIDMEFVTTAGKPIEYNFIVHPGANAEQIELRYDGANSTALNNGKLDIAVAHGTMQEEIPASFIQDSKLPVQVTYKRIGSNTYSYSVGNYDKTKTLIIDPLPNLSWATYYGGPTSPQGPGAENSIGVQLIASGGAVYMAGETNTSTTIATTGAAQSTLTGLTDAMLIKFNDAGVRQWGTYYGGFNNETVLSATIDALGNILMVGQTQSATMISTPGAHQPAISSTSTGEGFLVKFNTAGVRQWGTYYGGTNNDEIKTVTVDANTNDIYAGGFTESASGIATPSSAQPATVDQEDGFVVKFNASGVRQWATYIGGNNADRVSGMAVDGLGNLYVSGHTMSANASNIVTPGSHQPTFGGVSDYFLVKYNSAGVRQWGTYYGGSAQEGNFIRGGKPLAVDASNNVYMVGITNSTNNIATAGTYQPTGGGNTDDGYLAKFNSAGVRQWATYYGGTGYDYFFGIHIDAASNVYISGSTNSPTGLATTNAYQTAVSGANTFDANIAKFSSVGILEYATYYGGNNNDYCYGMVVDAGHVYVCGNTASTTGLATPGAHSTVRNGYMDAYLARFDACTAGQIQPNITTKDVTCFGDKDGSIILNPTGGIPPYRYGVATNLYYTDTINGLGAGIYQIIVIDTNDCMTEVYETISQPQVVLTPALSGLLNTSIGLTTTYTTPLQAAGITYKWVANGGTIIAGQGTNSATVQWNSFGTGNITVVAGNGSSACNDTASAQVFVNWPTGISDVSATGISIYPNPATNTVHIALQNAPAPNAVLQLHDGFGKLVMQQPLQQTQNIDISKLPAGIYYLNIGGERSKVTKL